MIEEVYEAAEHSRPVRTRFRVNGPDGKPVAYVTERYRQFVVEALNEKLVRDEMVRAFRKERQAESRRRSRLLLD